MVLPRQLTWSHLHNVPRHVTSCSAMKLRDSLSQVSVALRLVRHQSAFASLFWFSPFFPSLLIKLFLSQHTSFSLLLLFQFSPQHPSKGRRNKRAADGCSCGQSSTPAVSISKKHYIKYRKKLNILGRPARVLQKNNFIWKSSGARIKGQKIINIIFWGYKTD